MSTFLIVGKSFSGIENSISERGDSLIVLVDSSVKNTSQKLSVDFSDRSSLDNTINSLVGKVDAVFWVYENYVTHAAYIAKSLGILGLPVEAAERATDKLLMRQAFSKVPEEISANYSLVENEESLLDFAKKQGFPLVIKPANLTKSLLVTKSQNKSELLENYKKTIAIIDKVYSRYAPGRPPKLIVEEFLEGAAYSVEAFADKNGIIHILDQIVDYQTGYDIGYDDNFHYSRILPSKLSHSDQAALRKIAKLGVQALGMRNSPAHVEIIYTERGPRIVEIGARNGGYRSRMHRLANGLDINQISLDLAIGKQPHIIATKNESCAVLELFPKTPGKFLGINNEDGLKELSSLKYLKIKQKIGGRVGKSSDGYKMCAIIALHNTDAAQFNKDLEFVNNQVRIRTA